MSGKAKTGSDSLFFKTKMCKFYMAGTCMKSHECKFAHKQQELLPKPDFSCTRVCPEFQSTGRCSGGSECKFAHTPEELRARTKRHSRIVKDLRALMQMHQRSASSHEATSSTGEMLAESSASARPEVRDTQPLSEKPHVQDPPVALSLCMPVCILIPCCSPNSAAKSAQDNVNETQLRSFDSPGKDDMRCPESSWSRQSTAEPTGGPLDEFPSLGGCRGEEEEDRFGAGRFEEARSWFSSETQENPQFGNNEPHCRPPTAPLMTPSNPHKAFGHLTAACGLSYTVKHSFLTFSSIEGSTPVSPLRRARSLGDLPL